MWIYVLIKKVFSHSSSSWHKNSMLGIFNNLSFKGEVTWILRLFLLVFSKIHSEELSTEQTLLSKVYFKSELRAFFMCNYFRSEYEPKRNMTLIAVFRWFRSFPTQNRIRFAGRRFQLRDRPVQTVFSARRKSGSEIIERDNNVRLRLQLSNLSICFYRLRVLQFVFHPCFKSLLTVLLQGVCISTLWSDGM